MHVKLRKNTFCEYHHINATYGAYFKNLRQLHFLVVEDGVDAVNRLLGLMWRSTLGFLMQYGNQSPRDA